jgi:radical SAM protein with 4Fe4S-binding SPASM domain
MRAIRQQVFYEAPMRAARPPLPDGPAGAGYFFADHGELPAGLHAARFQVMAPPGLPEGVRIALEIRRTDRPGGDFLARGEREVDAEFDARADHLLLAFHLPEPAPVELRCWASAASGHFHLRALKVKRADQGELEDWAWAHDTTSTWPLSHLDSVVIGNAGQCNASCSHCPTNKAWLQVPAGEVMPEAIFTRLVDGLAEAALPIRGPVAFGLHGESFLDRDLATRVQRVKQALPGARVVVNTNGSIFSAAVPRHREVAEAADVLAVHVESLDPARYGRLMAPLRLERTLRSVARLVEAAGPKAHLVVPVHAENLAEIPALEAWWHGLGGGGPVVALPFTNRGQTSPGVLALHLAPIPGHCRQEVTQSLVVDWDGQVLACCQDFARETDLGSLARQTVPEVLADARRRRMYRLLQDQDWAGQPHCRHCLFDDAPAVAARVAAQRVQAVA